MKIKRDLEFESFSDGVCSIYCEDDLGNKAYKHEKIYFSNNVLGMKRFFSAQAVNVVVDKVIKIPFVSNIDTHDKVQINGLSVYDIELSQEIKDSNPPCLILSLRAIN